MDSTAAILISGFSFNACKYDDGPNRTKSKSPSIKKVMPTKEGFKFSVTKYHTSTVVVSIMKSPIEFPKGHIQVNPYYFNDGEYYSPAAKGVLSVGDRYLNEGPLGTIFEGRILEEATVGPYSAIVPEIAGQGWIYGMSQWIVDPSDPFQDGYTIGDIWG